ncbi:hypothetical protein DB42_AA00260 [Neochlamydia sp. EPS4]|uniref:pilus assembly protein PilM n=1 Tax=Neochlamydia sp. EPS4 TaxID=1478175 RepID=UPI0005829EDD|nr:pilus assembly protein PilM [Neochlamydia sp. EPS4]KIC75538.1 hypothetical protein DB42_AA00260 [Neochlamydia sp. EPS4]
MLDKPEASITLGLELEKTVLRGIQLTYNKGKPTFSKLFEITGKFDNVNPLYIYEEHPDLQKSLQKDLVITALDTPEVLIRHLEIKLKKEKDIEQVLAFQAEPLLPYPSDHAVLDYLKIGHSEEGSLLTVLAARKDYIQKHLQHCSQLRIEPEVITALPAALYNFAITCVSSPNPYCIIHLGTQQSTAVLIQDSKLIAAQSILGGVQPLKEALIEGEDGSINFADPHGNLLGANQAVPTYQAWESLRLEIKRVVFSLSKQARGQEVKELLITGSTSLIPNLGASLASDLRMQQIFPQPEIFPQLTVDKMQEFAAPLGIALAGLPLLKDKINFRRQEFSYPHPWKRLTKSLYAYAGLCIALALALYIFTQSYLAYHLDKVRQDYIELLQVMNKPYANFESSYEGNNSLFNASDSQAKDILELSEKDLLERVHYLEKNLQRNPDIFPLLPIVPKVSDVLAWLSTQDVLIGKCKGEKLPLPPIQIESFHYALVKRPEHHKKQEKYQVKVEIEFTSSIPKQAREFHDVLIEPNSFVDPKGEVKWNSSHGRYRTSFYLKDKTLYSSSS